LLNPASAGRLLESTAGMNAPALSRFLESGLTADPMHKVAAPDDRQPLPDDVAADSALRK